MSAVALALALFFGSPAETVEYRLFEDRGWFLLDDSFLREYEQHLPESLPKVKLDEEA